MPAPTRAPLNIFCDSDGVVADFETRLVQSGLSVDKFKHLAGAYLWLPVMPGAKEAIAHLKEHDDAGRIRLWIATKTPDFAPYSYTEKILWYREHFPWLENRVIIAHDKSQLGSKYDIIVDDRPTKGNVDQFRGTFIHFGSEKFPSWTEVLHALELAIVKSEAYHF